MTLSRLPSRRRRSQDDGANSDVAHVALTGKTFGYWTVLERADDRMTHPAGRDRPKRVIQYLCRCSCPACAAVGSVESVIPGDKLRAGRSESCGRPRPKSLCSVDYCAMETYSGGLCNSHWYRQKNYGDPLGGIEGAKVYVVQEDEEGPYKVGFTQGAIKNRVSALQIGNPRPLRLIGWTRGVTEAEVHLALQPYKVRGEWFECRPEVSSYIQNLLGTPPVRVAA